MAFQHRFHWSRIHWPHATPSNTWMMPQLCGAYNFPKITGGKAQRIGIIELGGGYRPMDIQTALTTWKLPSANLTDVPIGATNSPGQDADGEVVLDIEIVAAAYSYCTGQPANVFTYFAPNTDAGFAAAVQQAIADGNGTISISWGGPESTWGAAALTAFDGVCARAAAAGVTIFAASGDNDSGDGLGGVNVDFPASSPHVVGCGGTTKTHASEVVWNNGMGEGTGGGISAFFPKPTWQIGVNAANRGVPDLAALADPQTGYPIFLNGAWTVIGGTSAVAPLMAGFFAAINAALEGAGKPRVGTLLPILYQHPAALTDVTVGNNGNWRAGVGWDPCTGLGVPIGVSVLQALLPPSPPSPPPIPPPPVSGVITVLRGFDSLGGLVNTFKAG